MRIVVIIVVALLLISGAGAGAFFYFHQSAEASVGTTEEHQAAKEEKEADKDVFVELDPLLLPIIGSNGISQTVSMVIVIEVGDDKAAEIVKHLTPRLKDAYIQDMYGVLSRRNAMPNGTLDVGMVKERLNKVSQSVLGEGVVKGVLLQLVQQHPA
jgi:flagellar FliL protein